MEIIGLEPTTLCLQSIYSIQLSYIPEYFCIIILLFTTRTLIMLLLCIFLPLCGAFVAGFLGHRLGIQGTKLLTIGALFLSLLISIIQFCIAEESSYFSLYQWCISGEFQVDIEFLFDHVTFIMLFVVLTISLIVHIYSTQYLATDPHLPRFMSYLSFFTFFMLLLISAENFIQLFLGWEGVGLCSYLLINFWFTRIQANKSALKAVFINKIGDISLLFAISLIYYFFGSTSFSIIFATVPYFKNVALFFITHYNIINFIAFLLLIGVIGKSAQIGLHVWLPDAMEGPTPVSALLHAATMVTAGIFLIVRCSFLFEHAPDVLVLCLFVGSLTAFFAATTGLLQNDLKRIIAFSTCSQLGYMLVSCGLSQYSLSLFHLFNHAFFKALLFLAAGSVIHALQDEQDIRKMGGLANVLPLTCSFFVIASFSLMGFPFLSGFYSKDIIIESTLTTNMSAHSFASLLLLFAAFFTAAYSIRLVYYVFLTRPNFFFFNLPTLHEASNITQVPLIILALLSIFSGYLCHDLFIGFGSTFFAGSLSVLPRLSISFDNEFLNPAIKQLPLFFSLVGIGCALGVIKQLSLYPFLRSQVVYNFCCFLNQKWFFDKLYNVGALFFMKSAYFHFYSYLDKGIIEYIGPFGYNNIITLTAKRLRQSQSGHISDYFLVVFSIIFIFLLLIQFFS